MKYFISILFIFFSILNAESTFTMNNIKVYYEDTMDDLSGSISYCSDGHYLNDVRGIFMGRNFHQYQTGIWSYNTLKDQLTQTMYIAKDVNHGTIIEDYRENPSLSTTISNDMKQRLVEGAINNTTRIIKIEFNHALRCQQ